MDNYWYYTLSAIPQTLAAMIALAATFVVFKLNFLLKQISNNRNDLVRFMLLLTSPLKMEIPDIEQLDDKKFIKLYEERLKSINKNTNDLGLGEEMFSKFRDEMTRKIKSLYWSYFSAKPSRIYDYLIMRRDFLKRLIRVKDESLRLLFQSLIITAITIIISLWALPQHTNDPYLIVGIILILSSISVVFTVCSIWIIANN